MSADVRVASALQDLRAAITAIGRNRPTLEEWCTVRSAAEDLIDEAKDALHLTDDGIARY